LARRSVSRFAGGLPTPARFEDRERFRDAGSPRAFRENIFGAQCRQLFGHRSVAIYAVQIGADLWVIHAFQKKSKTGIKTPKAEIDLIRE